MAVSPVVGEAFAITAPGLAPLCAAELTALGLVPTAIDDAGVAFAADAAGLARANLWLATASRVVLRLATFEARGFPELERHARRVPWGAVVATGRAVRLRVTARKSRLYHTGAIAERLWGVLTSLGAVPAHETAADDEDDAEHVTTDDAQLLVVRVHRDVVTISADTSGDLLHRRGWRQATAKAPMRETLAAALLATGGYDGTAPLVDPLAGSGTIAIEAARRARGLAPGLDRRFAFEQWPGMDPAPLAHLRAAVRTEARPHAPAPIVANDRDPGAIAAIRGNAERAGVLADLDIRQEPASRLAFPRGPGLVATNPPYGRRITGGDDPRNLAAALGTAWRRAAAGWRVAIVAPTPALARAFALPLAPAVETRNGGLAIAFYTGTIPLQP